MFLNRTQAGLERRPHLAEAKLSPASMNEAQILNWFWEGHSNQWLHYAMDIPNPIPTLKQSLRALAVTRYGRLHGDEEWLRQGRRFYSEALSTLQKTLHGQPFHDETLTSARALVLYEFLESTSENPTAWETHLSGLERLLVVRGKPETLLGKAVFADVRYTLMCKALMRREKSPFSEGEWLLDEEGEQIWNCGFQIAAMLAASERGEDVRKDCIELYGRVDETEGEVLHRWAFQLLLLMMMERFSMSLLGDKEEVAKSMLEMLRENIMGEGEFRPARTLLPVNSLVWFYRNRPEFDECLKLKQEMARRGYLFARDVNKGELAVVKALQDGDGKGKSKEC